MGKTYTPPPQFVNRADSHTTCTGNHIGRLPAYMLRVIRNIFCLRQWDKPSSKSYSRARAVLGGFGERWSRWL